MPITGKSKSRTAAVIDAIADELGCEPAVIDAIITVECGGSAFDPVGRLVIRPEAHKIKVCPYLTEAEKKQAAKLGFTKQPKTPGYHVNPVGAGDQLWTWLDRFRMTFGDEAAYWITSFGSPQIMGFNHRKCGYELPSLMVLAFADHEDAQLKAMGQFLKSAGLVPALKGRNWKQIARTYNGVAYAKNHYDTKLRAAYEASKCRKGSHIHIDEDILEFGDQGDRVKTLQKRLRALGYYVDDDGDFGDETLDAVRAFQRRNALQVDGRVGPITQKALEVAAPKEPNQKPVKDIIKDSQTAQAGVGTAVVGGAGLAASLGSITAGPPPATSLDTVQTVVLHTERGVGVAQKVFALGAEKILLALAVAGIIFGVLAVYRRVSAQRARKVG